MKRRILLSTLAAFAVLTFHASATDGTFENAAGGSWSDSANWQNATVGGGAGSSVSISAGLSGNATISLDADATVTVGDLSVEDENGGHSWTISGSGATLAFDSGDGSSSEVDVADGTTLVTSSLTLANENAVVKTGAGQWTIAPAANNATFTQNPLVIREGTNYFSNVNSGGAKITLDSSDGSSPVIRLCDTERKSSGPTITVPAGTGNPVIIQEANGKPYYGKLDLERMVEINIPVNTGTLFGGGMTGTGGIRKTGSGTLGLGSGPTFNGKIVVSEGNVSCGSSYWNANANIAVTIGDEFSPAAASLGWGFSEKGSLPGVNTSFHVTTNGGSVSFYWSKNQSGATCQSAFVLDRDVTFNANINDGKGNTFAGVFSGVGGISFTGNGNTRYITLSGENTYSGGTSINSVTVKASANSALGTGNVSIGATGVLEYTADVDNVIADPASLSLVTGGVIAFGNHAITEKVSALVIDGQRLPGGRYGAVGSGAERETALITGSGVILVVEPATMVLFR